MENDKYDLDAMHMVQLNLLKKLKAVCEENNLLYFLGFGSLLGAVRDHKIIPWDDSIDVVMPYCDYFKLTGLPQMVWGDNVFLQTYDTDPQFHKYYARLRDSGTTLIISDSTAYDINQGIYINIMPLIKLSDNTAERTRQFRVAKLYKAVTEARALPKNEGLLWLRSTLLLNWSTEPQRHKRREALKEKVLRCEERETADCFALSGIVSLNLPLSRTWFSSAVDWDFEGASVKIPNGWHEWLSARYGDYMETPISELQGDKTSNFVTLNTQRSYKEYKGKTYFV